MRPFHGEESRRAIPAREMLASGDWVLPTIWGRPYLHKPPGHFWLVAAASLPEGAVDEWATRLPSALATVATAAVLYLWAAGLFGERAGLAAGLLFLLSLNVLGKGQVGEIEPPLGLAVASGLMLQWNGREGRWGALVGSGLLLGAAWLLKGPPALLFQLAAGIGIAVAMPGNRFLRSARFWVPVLLALLPVLAWAGLLLAQADTREALDTWWIEASRTGGRSNPAEFWSDRPRFLGGALGAFLPSTLLVVAAVGTETGRRLWREPVVRFMLVTLAASFAYFLVTPGPRPRYVYPLVPFACAIAACWVDRAIRSDDGPALVRLRWLLGLAAVAGMAAGLAGLAPLVRPVAGVDGVGAPGLALLVAIVGVGALGLHAARAGSTGRAFAAVLAVLALIRVFVLVELVPRLQGDRGIVERMHALEDRVPPDARLGLNVGAMWNELIYLRRPVEWIETPEQVEPGRLLLLDLRGRKRFAGTLHLEELAVERVRGHRVLSLVRVLD